VGLDSDVDATTAAGRLVVEIISAAAAFESCRIGERVKAVHGIRRAQGKPAGQLPVLPETARRRIAQLRATAPSLAAIADQLNTEGVATAKGGSWYASTIAHVLHSVALDEELEWVGRSSSA
jgi:DNA invertase Pin-like site-specific DNA recombinase